MFKFKRGDKVRIRGEQSDFTDHLDGQIGTVIAVTPDECLVKVEGYKPYIIWNYNMELVHENSLR